ncbi:MAG: glycosyltransferase family 39 protein, partial [Thermodesulfobacteriota bacterium]
MKRVSILLHILFPAVFVIVVLLIAPLKEVFEYDPDEGINVMKALLYLKGFSLYDEIWNDQPPLLTYIMSYWFNLFGLLVYQGRLLVLIFSAILLWAYYQTIRNSWGHLCASLAVVFLLLSANYLRLSISVMVGLPALTFAMLSIYGLTLYRKFCLKRWLILSGILMALSLQTKLFAVFLVPIIILEILQIEWANFKSGKQLRHLFFPAMLWLGTFLAVYLCIALLFFPENFHQLLQFHLETKEIYPAEKEWIRKFLVQDYDIVLLAFSGTVLLIRQRKWHSIFPLTWFLLAVTLLLNHKPVWSHHYLLLSIPLSWLAAICFSEFFRIDIRHGWFP